MENAKEKWISAGGLSWRVHSSQSSRAVQNVLEAPEKFLQTQSQILRSRRENLVGSADGLILKRYEARVNFRRWNTVSRALFRPSQALDAFQKGIQLQQAGLPTAQVLAAAEKQQGLFCRIGYLLTEEIPNATPLVHWRGDRRAALCRVAELVARLHEKGFSHRDLSGSNLILDPQGNPYLLDLDALRVWERVPGERAALDLKWFASQIVEETVVRPSEQFRFLLLYAANRGGKDARGWLQQIQKMSKRR